LKGGKMKKGLLTTLLILVFATGAFAADGPVDKGSMILGGTVYFQSASGDLYKNMNDDSQTMIALAPEFGYFIAPSIMIGMNFEYSKWSWGDDVGVTTLDFGPMVGYYFNMDPNRAEVKGALYPYIKGFFNMCSEETEGVDDKDKTTSFGGKGGINYMLSDAVALDFGIQFQSDSWKVGDGESTSGTIMWFGAGISAFIY